MTGKEGLHTIKNIGIYHIEMGEVDPYCPEMGMNQYEVYDGDIKQLYKKEVKAIKNDIETLELLKKHIRFGNGVFTITIDEYDPDFEKVKKLIEKERA